MTNPRTDITGYFPGTRSLSVARTRGSRFLDSVSLEIEG